MVMHAYNHGLVTIDIQYVEQTSTHKSLEERYSYKVISNSNTVGSNIFIARPIIMFLYICLSVCPFICYQLVKTL